MSYISDYALLAETYTKDILGKEETPKTKMSLDAILDRFEKEIRGKALAYQSDEVMSEQDAVNKAIEDVMDQYHIELATENTIVSKKQLLTEWGI